MANSKIWYVVIEGRADGPHTEDQLKEWLHSSKISYSDLVFRPGLARWVSAAECKEFERRSDEETPADIGGNTAVKLDVPQDTEDPNGWVALVKHDKIDGSNHYIQSGPYSTEQIRERISAGQIKYEDHVWQKGFKNWTPVSEVKDFERRRDPETPPPMPSAAAAAQPEIPKNDTAASPIVPQATEKMAEIKMASGATAAAAAAAPTPTPVAPAAPAAASTSSTSNPKPVEVLKPMAAAKTAMAPKAAQAPKAAAHAPAGAGDAHDGGGHEGVTEEEVEESTQVDKEIDQWNEEPQVSAKPRRSRRLIIAAGGAALAMALVYAGINSYKEILGRKGERHVAAEEAPIPPPPPLVEERPVVPPAPVAQQEVPVPAAPAAPPAMAKTAPVVPVDPEIQNPKPKDSTTLKVMTLKGSDRPQLALETDLPPGSQIDVRVAARAGSILRYPTFLMNKKVSVQAGQMPSLDLSGDKLPAGTYRVSVESGSLKDATNLLVGIHDSSFNKKLAAFRKVVQKQAKAEKATLTSGVRFLASSYQAISSGYQQSKASGNSEARKKWNMMLRNWRKEYDKEVRSMKTVSEYTRNHFVYPEQLLRLKALNVKMKDVATTYDQSLKSGRSVASDSDPGVEFKGSLKELKSEVVHLK